MTRPSDIDAEKAVRNLYDLIPRVSKAKGELTYLDEYTKSLKAILMKKSGEQTAAAQEREALAHPDYINHLKGLSAATEAYEALRYEFVVIQGAIDIWRSKEASNRAIDRATA